MDAIELLRNQHQEVEMLLHELATANTRGKTRKQLFERVADLLATHAALEERIFYPGVNERDTEEHLLEALEMHLAIKRVTADLMHLEEGDPTFRAKTIVLRDLVLKHQHEEERRIFPAVLARMDTDRLDDLGREMEGLLLDFETRNPRGEIILQTDRAASLNANEHFQGIIAEFQE